MERKTEKDNIQNIVEEISKWMKDNLPCGSMCEMKPTQNTEQGIDPRMVLASSADMAYETYHVAFLAACQVAFLTAFLVACQAAFLAAFLVAFRASSENY